MDLFFNSLLFKISCLERIFQWKEYKNIIYDFDVLFPKPLALALESNKINTIAIQERPNTSFGFIQGVIVDKYLFAGEIYKKYGRKNKSFIFKSCYNFGMWRTSLFDESKLLPIQSISFKNSRNLHINKYKTFITFLGHFYDDNNNKAGLNNCTK